MSYSVEKCRLEMVHLQYIYYDDWMNYVHNIHHYICNVGCRIVGTGNNIFNFVHWLFNVLHLYSLKFKLGEKANHIDSGAESSEWFLIVTLRILKFWLDGWWRVKGCADRSV